MEIPIILSCIGFTSLTLFLVGNKLLGLRPTDLSHALVLFVETIGISIIFLMINIGVGLIALLSLRLTTSMFISLYILGNYGWIVFSLVQGFLFQCLRK